MFGGQKLKRQFQDLPPEDEEGTPKRSEREILEEILDLVRSQIRSVAVQERSPLKPEPKIDEPKTTSLLVKSEQPSSQADAEVGGE
jgi:hypothetical protein